MSAERVSEADVIAAYQWAERYAVRRAGVVDELREVARDAATMAVFWARDHFREERAPRGFPPFAKSAVKRRVWRAIQRHAQHHHRRPSVVSLAACEWDVEGDGPELESRPGGVGTIALPEAVADLPPDLRDAVRLFYIDRFTQREGALLCGCSQWLFRQRLREAARLLGTGLERPAVRSAGAKRMVR